MPLWGAAKVKELVLVEGKNRSAVGGANRGGPRHFPHSSKPIEAVHVLLGEHVLPGKLIRLQVGRDAPEQLELVAWQVADVQVGSTAERWGKLVAKKITKKQKERLAAYRPLLLKDQDWDFGFLIDLVIFKLERMAKCIAEADHHLNCQRVARDIRIAAEHLKRAQNSHKYGPPYPFPQERLFEEKSPRERAIELRWARQHNTIEKENWDAAWEMIRRKGRTWWD